MILPSAALTERAAAAIIRPYRPAGSAVLRRKNMKNVRAESDFFGQERVGKILLHIAPPVMLAQLIQALYNIVDSFFVGRYSDDALTALTVIYPLQLIIIALAVGTGVGVNTYMARKYAQDKARAAEEAAGTGMVLELISWAIFAVAAVLVMRPYVMTSATSPAAIEDAVTYGTIVSVGSLGAFLEGNWTKVHQARGNMRLPMVAQMTGALVNILLDPLLIFGLGPCPALGVAGAAYATVCGQVAAAAITAVGGFRRPPALRDMLHYAGRIYYYGYSNIIMQCLYTVYILALNIILAGFSDAAVTVLGLYYKAQSFFFIPLFGLQTCVVPVLSYNYARGSFHRCRRIMRDSFLISALFMVAGVLAFTLFPTEMMNFFSQSPQVHAIGAVAFPIIALGFIPAVFSLMTPVFFQAVGDGRASLLLSLTRQIFCLIPLFWLFSLIGLNYTWFAFPVSETISGAIGLLLYHRTLMRWNALHIDSKAMSVHKI